VKNEEEVWLFVEENEEGLYVDVSRVLGVGVLVVGEEERI
jgi:hypothetical protein